MAELGSLYFSLGLNDKEFKAAIEKAKENVQKLTGEVTLKVNLDMGDVGKSLGKNLETGVQNAVDSAKGKIENLKKLIAESEKDLKGLDPKTDMGEYKRTSDRLAEQKKHLSELIAEQEKEAKTVNKVAESLEKLDEIQERTTKKSSSKTETSSANAETKALEDRAKALQKLNEQMIRLEGIGDQMFVKKDTSAGEGFDRAINEFKKLQELGNELKSKSDLGSSDIGAFRAKITAFNGLQRTLLSNQKEHNKAKEAESRRAAIEEERELARYLNTLNKQSRAVQKAQATRNKAVKYINDASSYVEGKRMGNSQYDDISYQREQLRLKQQYEEQEKIAIELEKLEKQENDIKKKAELAAKAKQARESAMSNYLTSRMIDYVNGIGSTSPEISRLNSFYRRMESGLISPNISAQDRRNNQESKNALSNLIKLEEAIRRLNNLKIKIQTSGLEENSDNIKEAIRLIDEYVDKINSEINIAASGKAKGRREITDVLGQNMQGRISRINLLVKAQKELEMQTEKQIEADAKASEQQGKLQESLRSTENRIKTVGQVLGQVFNYYMIDKFVRNLYIIGGEFQKQQIALQAMIGDVNKANALFERTKKMAVFSPFTFSELAKYTKQISAFGIEYENLFDTTKRLADLSAGLGVDVGRLILAFGQVRSAAVLRGQELRQFTEAGIPMVNELAKAFSKLEKKEVKAAEVFDKISRREVPFAMVRDVLFGMTDPGGRFYEMQEELAKSLAGQWSNLKDAWDIMISEIANSSHGPLNNLASIIRGVINEWRIWLPLISGAAAGITALNAGLKITQTLVTIGFANAAALNPWIAGLAAVAGVATAAYGFISSIETEEEMLKRLNTEAEETVSINLENEKIANRYLDTLSKTASSEKERADLLKVQESTLEALRNMYMDIVGDVKLEELTTKEILRLRQRISEITDEQNNMLLDDRIEATTDALNKAKEKVSKLEKYNIQQDGAEILSYIWKSITGESEEDVHQAELKAARDEVTRLENELTPLLDRRQEIFDRSVKLSEENLTNWREKAAELIEGTTLQAPKEDQSMLEYFNYLKEEYDAGKSEFEKYAEDNPLTAANKKAAGLLRDAANRVNIGLGGMSFLEGKKEEIDRNAEKIAKDVAKKFAEGLRYEIERIASQWDLYKQLFEATGDKAFASTAFQNTQVWDEAARQMLSKFKETAKLQGIDWDIDFDISDADAKVVYEDFYDSWKSIKDRIEKNGIDLKLNVADIIKNSKDFDLQVQGVERELHQKLDTISKSGLGADAIGRLTQGYIEQAEEAISEIEFEKFKKEIGYAHFFSTLEHQGASSILAMREAMLKFADSTGLSIEEMDVLLDDVEKMMNALVENKPFKAIDATIEHLNELRESYKKASAAYKANPTTENRKSMESSKSQLDAAYDTINKSFDEISGRFGRFSNTVGEVSELLEKFGNTSLRNFAEMLDSISSGMSTGKNVGSLFGGAGGPVGTFVGAAVGAIAGLVAAGQKAAEEEIKASEQVASRMENVASLLKESIQSSLSGLYSPTLSGAEKVELEHLKAEYEAALKYYNDRGDKLEDGNIYIHVSDDTSFPWDTNGYSIYNSKTLDAINKALETDNAYLATYAAMLKQRDELYYQQATYSDKDGDKVEQYKRDKSLEIEELNREIESFATEMMSALYSIDFDDWAGQFADAIVDAWAKGESAAEAYENTVGSVLKNVASEIVRQSILGKYLQDNLKPLVEMFDSKGGVVDEEFFKALVGVVSGLGGQVQKAEDFIELLEKAANEAGFSMKDLDSISSSSGISKGIQSVTEDTANLLGSYLNAIRQDVSIKRSLVEKLIGEDVPKMNYLAQAQLAQLNQITQNTKRNADTADRIFDLVNRVIDKGSNKLRV